MKICDRESQSKFELKLINSSMLEDQIKQLKTTRSCPTGFSDQELKSTATIELLHLRKTTYQYLNLKSSKTRNVQFILLIQRINKELMRRNVYIPVSSIEEASIKTDNFIAPEKKSHEFDEITHFIQQQIITKDSGQYCYLARKRGVNSNRLILDSTVIYNSHFSISKNFEKNFPQFLQDNLVEPLIKKSQVQVSEENSTHSTSEFSKKAECKKILSSPVQSLEEFFHYDDLAGFVPAINNSSFNNDFDADEKFFFLQHK